jgi:transcriptional regulator with XRE-family HTH domain
MHINSVNRQENIQEMKAIGERIKNLRKGLGMNQTELANAVGVKQSSISDIERGGGIEASTLMSLARALLKSPQFIMTGEEAAFELSEEEALVIKALRESKSAAQKAKKTGDTETKQVSSPMSKPRTTKKRGAA